MCDYSLHAVASRPAKVGERLVSTVFPHTLTRGFAAADDCNTAVCLQPGTELAFDRNIEFHGRFFRTRRVTDCNTARMRAENRDQPYRHHDTLELADGRTILVTDLVPGQSVTVLQLPVIRTGAPQPERTAPAEGATAPARDLANLT